jgi:hypothetical protein
LRRLRACRGRRGRVCASLGCMDARPVWLDHW